jgi:GT2 family glycosyltransferase
MEYKYDVSVCIPYAEDWPMLYFTLNNIVATLVASKLTHEIIVVANNSTLKFIEDANKLITAVDFQKFHNSQLIVSPIPANGPAANECYKKAQGKYICFTDSHVIVWHNIFTECLKVMDRYEDAGLIHAPIVWTGFPHNADFNFAPGKRCFQYLYRTYKKDDPEWYLWQHFHGQYNHQQCAQEAYPIAGCGHGFFMVRNEVWQKIGGYHGGQRGYGGREPFVTFKAWLLGHRNFTVPTTCHCHYNGRRNYFWSNDLWYRNVLQQAYCTGGEKWLDKIYQKFASKKGVRPEVMKMLRDEAVSGCAYDKSSEKMASLIMGSKKSEEDRTEYAKIWLGAAKMGVESSEPIRKFVVDNQKYEFDDLFKLWDDTGVFY